MLIPSSSVTVAKTIMLVLVQSPFIELPANQTRADRVAYLQAQLTQAARENDVEEAVALRTKLRLLRRSPTTPPDAD